MRTTALLGLNFKGGANTSVAIALGHSIHCDRPVCGRGTWTTREMCEVCISTIDFKIEDKIKTQLEILKRLDTYVISTNVKCTIAISYCAAVVGWILSSLEKLMSNIPAGAAYTISGICLTIGIGMTFICLARALKIIFPITFSSPTNHNGASNIFYGDVAAISAVQYLKNFQSIDCISFSNDLAEQIHTVSCIAKSKFDSLKSLTLLIVIGNILPLSAFSLIKISAYLVGVKP